ncbi:MAG: hypothetical protein RL398_3446 [Planctomycetota bacterium]
MVGAPIDDSSAREPGVLASRLGRRLVALFVGAALLPLMAFAAIALHHVSGQLEMETERVLHNGAKTAGMGVAARLSQAAGDLRLVRAAIADADDSAAALHRAGLDAFLAQRFDSVWRTTTRRTDALLGEPPPAPVELDAAQQAHIAAGLPIVRMLPDSADASMEMLLDPERPELGTLGGVIRSQWLWQIDELRIPGAEVVVFESFGRPLFGSVADLPGASPLLAAASMQPASGSFAWQVAGEPHLARYWRVFLRPQYGFDLLVVQSRAETEAFAGTRGFQRWFVLTSSLALLAVLLISLSQVRRQLRPLQAIRGAAQRVARGDYRARVAVAGRDEFGELAVAFNHMTGEIEENIRRREATERDLVASRDAALAAARAKAEFVTNVSHEFRTPMTEILGAAEILAKVDGLDDAAREEFSAIALSGARKLARMIDDVLELGGSAGWTLEPCDLGATVREAVEATTSEVRERVRLQVPADDLCVDAVAHRLTDSWLRLLDNAAKFSAADTPIDVRVRRDGAEVVVEVVDRGVGISRLDLDRVFEPFLQVGRDQLTDKAHGAGLGLSIVRNTVERHGGRIEVDSELGAGTTFVVRLPLVRKADAAGSADRLAQ